MSFPRLTATTAVTLLLTACSSTWPPHGEPTAQRVSPTAETRPAYTAQTAPRTAPPSKPPVLTVGVSDPNTQLILPWFLTDMINAVNAHQSFGDLLGTMKQGL